jgi:dTDP-D-glucose 4,6-dehydratase
MKALKILKELLKPYNVCPLNEETTQEVIKAIEEIEELQNRTTCNGCKHYIYDSVDGCTYCVKYENDCNFLCDRLGNNDRYETKESK